MSEYRILYVTCGSVEEAEHIARGLVERRLIACGNILPAMRSVFRWEDGVTCEEECVLLGKTTASAAAAATEAIVELHGYDLPCVVAVPIADGHRPFLDWVGTEVTGTDP